MPTPFLAYYTVVVVDENNESATSTPLAPDQLYLHVTNLLAQPTVDEVLVFGHMKYSQEGEVIEKVLLAHHHGEE